ncbi:hypothetical protein BOV91_00765, partial [Solemya velum gill symbiont]
MNEGLTWGFEASLSEWLIVLALLAILAVAGGVVTRRLSLKISSKPTAPASEPDSVSESWHAE